MTISVDFGLKGFAELDRALQRLGAEFAGPALQRAVDAGAAVLEPAVRAAAPVRTSPTRGILIGGPLLSRKMAKRIALRSARAGGAVQLTRRERRTLEKRMHRLAQGRRRFPGYLRRQIGSTRARLLKSGQVTAKVGIGDAFYGRFLELGTRKLTARAWMGPAAAAAVPQVLQAISARLRVEILYAPRRRW